MSARAALAFLLLVLVVAGLAPPPVRGAVLTVCPSGCNYSKIQNAVDAAQPFDTVRILSTYNANTAGETFPVTVTVSGDITITGEVDSSGVPITVVDIASGSATPHDGFIIVTDRVLLTNLKIVDSSTTLNDLSRVIAAGSWVRTRNVGLSVRNVVIDFTSTGWHSGNGFDLIADNVVLDGNSVTGITGVAISIDGNDATITNNRITGVDSLGAVRIVQGVGFGADLPGPPCSGSPSGYVISNNVFIGVNDGVIFCNGVDTLISRNSFQDVVNSAIESAGSDNVTVANNTITWVNRGGDHGIGFSDSQSITIQYNQVSGRSARDTSRGIVLGTCTSCIVRGNTVENMAGDALILQMANGISTGSLIEKNTVRNNSGNGLSYIGSDQSSTTVDTSVVQNNVVTANWRNGIIFTNVKGSGNAVKDNVVTQSNLGGYANTHGFNLQGLRNTLIQCNEAYDTSGGGAGFLLANSQSLTGGGNTGSGNAGGLMVQVNVSPAFTNPTTSCGGGGGGDPSKAYTSILLSASPNPPVANSPVTFSVTLQGTWHELSGVVASKQIVVSAWGTSGSCTTDGNGFCQVTLNGPSVEGTYQVSADFAGDANFNPSDAQMGLTVNPAGIRIAVTINVNSYPGTFRLRVANTNNIAVCIRQQDIARGQSATLTCIVNPGTYRVEVYRYTSRIWGPRTISVPPDYLFTINYASGASGPIQPASIQPEASGAETVVSPGPMTHTTASTSLTISASPNPVIAGTPVTFTVRLAGTWHELSGYVSGKLVVVSAWGQSGSCTTGSDGRCQVTLTAPGSGGGYSVSAQFVGDYDFTGSSATMTLSVSPSGIRIAVTIAVNSYPGTFRLRVANMNNVAVCIKSQDVAKGQTVTLTCIVNAGTYRVEVYRYTARIYGPVSVTVPPDYTFNINYADPPQGPIQPNVAALAVASGINRAFPAL